MHLRTLYSLTKPGIVYGNAMVAAAAFVFATASGGVSPEAMTLHAAVGLLFVATLVGLSLIVASACVFNNYFDRHIDARMERTKGRALASGHISGRRALTFGTTLGVLGAMVLFSYTNLLTLAVAAVGWVVYVVLYSPLKHRTAHALWVGAVAGATPPVVGYTAVTNTLDLTALYLFLFLFLWQIPHFLAIAYYRFDEYTAAGIPLLIHQSPSAEYKRIARMVFYASLVVLLVWCLALLLI